MNVGHIRVAGRCERVAPVLARIGDKWAVLVVVLLADGPVRFNELKRRIGVISQRMLTFTLRGLERDGLVTRTVFASVPPKVEYALTPLGQSLLEPISHLSRLGRRARRRDGSRTEGLRWRDARRRGGGRMTPTRPRRSPTTGRSGSRYSRRPSA